MNCNSIILARTYAPLKQVKSSSNTSSSVTIFLKKDLDTLGNEEELKHCLPDKDNKENARCNKLKDQNFDSICNINFYAVDLFYNLYNLFIKRDIIFLQNHRSDDFKGNKDLRTTYKTYYLLHLIT